MGRKGILSLTGKVIWEVKSINIIMKKLRLRSTTECVLLTMQIEVKFEDFENP